MATKIGFKAQPLIDSGGVDWLSVGRDVVKTLTDQEKAREETRQKGEQAYRDEIKRLGSVELGKDALANQWIMNTVDSITGTAGIDQKLWKSGALSTKDYLRNKANRKNGTDLVLQSYNTYNKNYNEVMDGIANGTLAKEKMLFLRAQAESMFDFEKTGVIVNPETSEVSVAKKDLVDGVYVMSENPNEFLNASELLQASSALYTAFDADKAASDLAKDVAQTVLRNMGGTDIEQAYKALYNAPKGTQEKLNQARKDQIRAILNSEDAGAFLTDYLNEGFSFTKDSDEAATKNGEMSKMILLNQDGSTSLTEEQLNYAVDKFDGILEAYLPKKQKAPLPEKKSDREKLRRGQVESAVDNIAKLWYGTTQEIDAASKFLKGIIPNLVGIDVQENKVILTKTDKDGSATGDKGSRYPVEYAREDFNLFIESISGELGGNVSASEAVNIATKSLPTGRTAKGGIGTFLIPEAVGLPEKFGNYIETYLTETLPLSKDEEEAKSQLEGLLKPFGNFEIEEAYAGDDRVKITYPTGKTTAPLELKVDLSDADAVQQIKNFLINNIAFFQEGVEVQEKMIDKGPAKTKRTISQIIKEDGVTPAEALKIFKAQ
jgi:hypothetical protein